MPGTLIFLVLKPLSENVQNRAIHISPVAKIRHQRHFIRAQRQASKRSFLWERGAWPGAAAELFVKISVWPGLGPEFVVNINVWQRPGAEFLVKMNVWPGPAAEFLVKNVSFTNPLNSVELQTL